MTEPDRRSRVPQRFVPTLTEVFVPQAQVATSQAPSAPLSRETLETVVNAAMARLDADLTERLPEALSVLLHEQALSVSEQIRRELKRSARQAVLAALADALAEKK